MNSSRAHLRSDRQFVLSLLILGLLVFGFIRLLMAAEIALKDPTSDFDRQWIVEQYVLRQVNPYPIALAALNARYGMLFPAGSQHLRDMQISDIPTTSPDPQTIAELGPPTATYPPTSALLLVPIGLIPRGIARAVWLGVNVIALFLLTSELINLAGLGGWKFFFLMLGLVGIWPASVACIDRGQFALVSLLFVLLGFRLQAKYPIAAGLLYCVSLVKPSLALPFMLIPVLDRRLKVLATVAVSETALLGAASWWMHSSPLSLIKQWLAVSSYFLQGMYTVQDLINSMRLDGSWIGAALQLAVLGGAAVIAARLPRERRFSVLAVASCTWTYHGNYDFVVLLIPAAFALANPSNIWLALDGLLLGVVGLGLTRTVFYSTHVLARPFRWLVRLSLVLMVPLYAMGRRGWSTERLKVFQLPGRLRRPTDSISKQAPEQ